MYIFYVTYFTSIKNQLSDCCYDIHELSLFAICGMMFLRSNGRAGNAHLPPSMIKCKNKIKILPWTILELILI